MGGLVAETERLALPWVLNQSDGQKSLLDIARRAGLTFTAVRAAAERLLAELPAVAEREVA